MEWSKKTWMSKKNHVVSVRTGIFALSEWMTAYVDALGSDEVNDDDIEALWTKSRSLMLDLIDLIDESHKR